MAKKEIDPLEELLASKVIGSYKAADDIANYFLQIGRNRNLLENREAILKYVSVAIYALANHLPMSVYQPSRDENLINPVRCRSRVGDIGHLIVFLSYKPMQVLDFLCADKEARRQLGFIAHYYEQGEEKKLNELFHKLIATMNSLILDGGVKTYAKLAYSFRISQLNASPMLEEADPELFNHTKYSNTDVLVRCQSRISRMMASDIRNDSFNLKVLGQRLRTLRMGMNYNQKKMAAEICITPVAVTRMEAGGPVSAGVLIKFLNYFSHYVTLDVLFDDRMWELAQLDQNLITKKIHISSVVNRKVELLKESLIKKLDITRDSILTDLDALHYQIETGMNSVLSLTNED